MIELVRNFGPSVAIAISCILVMIWIVKVSITHFIITIKEATEERRELVKQFTNTVDNHITQSTERNIEQTGVLKGLTAEVKDMRSENRRLHPITG